MRSMSKPSSTEVLVFKDSNGGKGVFVPSCRIWRAGAGAGASTSAPTPRPAKNVTIATTIAIAEETPLPPRIAAAGGTAPPSAMPGAITHRYLKCPKWDVSDRLGQESDRGAAYLSGRPPEAGFQDA